MSTFANCSGFNESQIITLAALRGGTSAVAALATAALLVITCACQSRLHFGTEGRWLKVCIFALFGVSISYLSVLALGVVYHLLPAASESKWCLPFGFLDQILSVIQITLLFIVIMEAFWSRGHEQNYSRVRKWVLRGSQGTVLVVAVLIVAASVVPFVTGTYGEVGGWCWIVSIDEDCEVLVVGLLEQIFLWIVYHALISLICILMVFVAVFLFLRACKRARNMGNYDSMDGRHDLKHLFIKYIFQLIILVPIFVDAVDFVLAGQVHHYSFILWVLFATTPPISGFLIPLSFLLYIKFGSTNSAAERTLQIPMEHSSYDIVPREDASTSRAFVSAEENPTWYQNYSGTEQMDGQARAGGTEQLDGQAPAGGTGPLERQSLLN